MVTPQIERFFLYGEPARPVAERFVHLEYLDERSRPANWIIRPHSHADLHQVFYVSTGGGVADADGRRLAFMAPCMVAVPAGVVHGFSWEAESAGRVLTFSASYLGDIAARDASVQRSFGAGMWVAALENKRWEDMLDLLGRELGWRAPAHDLAVEMGLGLILVELLRAHHDVSAAAQAPVGPQAQLVARYRQLVESRFRSQPSIAALAQELGVSVSALRSACKESAGKSPIEILHERILLEARRLMRYSNMSIGQVAAYLGFTDAAYFSRFFSREAGASPRAFKHAAER